MINKADLFLSYIFSYLQAVPVAVAAAVDVDDANMYRKLTHLQHIRERPDSYVGSVVAEPKRMWVLNDETIVSKEISYVPGLYKCIDELIVNAMDQATVDDTLETIRVDVMDDDTISVYNDGKGMPVVMHEEHGVYVPELVFGHLLTSSNYDDSKERIVGGRNGVRRRAVVAVVVYFSPLFSGS